MPSFTFQLLSFNLSFDIAKVLTFYKNDFALDPYFFALSIFCNWDYNPELNLYI
jgi:hypothetical protein